MTRMHGGGPRPDSCTLLARRTPSFKIQGRSTIRRTTMLVRSSIGTIAVLAALAAAHTAALAFDDAKYPDWKGQWTRVRVPGAVGQPPHDPAKPPGRGQGAPLTPEYQARFEANLADQAAGGQ